MPDKKITVLVVDDSALVRKLLVEGLSEDPELEVVGAAADAYEARDMIVRKQPDVVTLDVEMPRMDGLEFLRRIMPRMPIRAVMVSGMTRHGQQITLRALELGAVDFVAKPSGGPQNLGSAMTMLRQKVKVASRANVAHWKGRVPESPPKFGPERSGGIASKLIVLGASTGGTEAIKVVLHGLPREGPGVLVVQHMPEEFSYYYAERLSELFPMKCKVAADGDVLAPGCIFVAPGGVQTRVTRTANGYALKVGGRQQCNGHAPSVDTALSSVAEHAGADAAAALLTGMGRDGAAGLLACRRAGARTLAQDEYSCTVFGMPKAALDTGAVDQSTPLVDIPAELVRWMKELEIAS
ncbi:MAG: chemotaxis-specific protein-glutamate methyltransferase CheB [Nannocystaceae bacterium]|nr:chemotaxis-specific protein-glutamate methyltransferase CheB [bacterium]